MTQWYSACPVCSEIGCTKAECKARLREDQYELIIVDLDRE